MVLMLRDGSTSVVEREHIVDELVSRRTEQVIDPCTGESRIRTLELVEKVVEKEVIDAQSSMVVGSAIAVRRWRTLEVVVLAF